MSAATQKQVQQAPRRDMNPRAAHTKVCRRRACRPLLNVGLTRTRVPTATPEDDRGEKAEPRRYAVLTLFHVHVHVHVAYEKIDDVNRFKLVEERAGIRLSGPWKFFGAVCTPVTSCWTLKSFWCNGRIESSSPCRGRLRLVTEHAMQLEIIFFHRDTPGLDGFQSIGRDRERLRPLFTCFT